MRGILTKTGMFLWVKDLQVRALAQKLPNAVGVAKRDSSHQMYAGASKGKDT